MLKRTVTTEERADSSGDRLLAVLALFTVEQPEWTVEAAVETLLKRGAQMFLCTNIDHDGMLHGQDLDGLTRISRLLSRQGKLIASGGVGSLNDLELLVQRKLQNLDSVIVGKALYEQRFTLHEANRALQGKE